MINSNMQLVVNGAMRQVLHEAAGDLRLPKEVREAAATSTTSDHVAWATLKSAVAALNEHRPTEEALLLHVLCSGSSIVLPHPPVKPPNPELEARRQMLRAKLENQQYAEMVKDITEKERHAEDMRGSLATYQAQMSFAAHVLVTMFTFFALCYWGSKQWLGWDELWAGLLGALGLTAGMLLETSLLIIRSNMPPSLDEQYPHLVDPKIWGRNRSKQPQQAGSLQPAATSSSASSHKGGWLSGGARGAAAATGTVSTADSKKRR